MADNSSADKPNMATDAGRDNGTDGSELTLWSMGLVAANKELGSRFIEALPIERLPMFSGEVTDKIDIVNTKGIDALGRAYESKLKTTLSISAEWLPRGTGNRITPPDVRRGEMVYIWRYADVDKYYWESRDDFSKRKLETAIWAFSNTSKEGEDNTATTSYFVEVSTHKKIMHIHMADNDGEVTTYDFQFNGKDGYAVLADGIGNYIKLNSPNNQIRLETALGAFADLSGKDLTIDLAGGNFTLKAGNIDETGSHTLHGDSVVKGGVTAQTLSMAAGGGGATATFNGPVQFNAAVTGTSDITTTGEVHGSNIN